VKIGPLTLSSNLCLAPLAGYTDLAFRRLVRGLGGVGLATTEVVSARAVVQQSQRGASLRGSLRFLRTAPEDRPLSVQLDGGNVTDLVEAARIVEGLGHAAIDINMGCPVPKLTESGGGAAWTCAPERAAEAVAAVAAAVRVPVTVKMRLGWDERSITAPDLARACEAAGAAAVFVHGRTRAQGFGGAVSRAGIAAVVRAVRAIPVVGNGDVTSPEAARAMLDETGCAGVAIGRAALTDPWIFARTRAYLDGTPAPRPGIDERLALIRRHYDLLVDQDGEHRATIRFRCAGVWYGPALRLSKEYRRRVSVVATRADVEHILDDVASGKLRQRLRPGAGGQPRVPVPAGPVDRW
jgi:nifR3 family TIM-barrel protein